MKKKICLSILMLFLLFPGFVRAAITVNDHTTLHYTKNEVIQKYQESLAKYDYNKSYYVKTPVFTPSSYYEGTLNDTVKQDVLRQYNFYRWVSGLNTVTINESKMARSQKGAFINALNNKLTHTPARPEGMSDEFYHDAFLGNYAAYEPGDIFSGNVSMGTPVQNIIKGYVDDSSNVEPNVGHRSSMLDPYAKQISFGYVERYSAVSVYYDSTNNNSDSFYAWPPAGYLPVDSFPATSRTMWSIWLGDYKVSKDTKVSIEFEGKTYEILSDKLYYEDYSTTLYYYVPAELNQVISSNGKYVTDKKVNFKIQNLSKGADTVTIEYPTTFVSEKDAPVVSVKDIALTINGKSLSDSFHMESGKTYSYQTSVTPSNAAVGTITVTSSDESIVAVDSSKKAITAKKSGSAKVVVKDSKSGVSKEITILVKAKESNVSEDKKEENKDPEEESKPEVVSVTRFDLVSKNKITINEGKKSQIEVKIQPENATEKNITWKSSNETVATVDENGVVLGLKQGSAKITGTLKNGMKVDVDVTIQTVPMKSMVFEEKEITIYRKENKELVLVVDPVDATDVNKIVWTSSDEDVAQVKDGVVSALSEGTAVIRATFGELVSEIKVNVKEVHLKTVSVVDTKKQIVVGEQTQLNLLLNPEDVTDDYAISYQSSDNKVATIDSNGVVQAVGAGDVVFTVDVNGIITTHSMKVSAPVSPKTGVATIYGSVVLSFVSVIGIGLLLRKKAKLK